MFILSYYLKIIDNLIKNVKIPKYDFYISSAYVCLNKYKNFYNYHDNSIEYIYLSFC